MSLICIKCGQIIVLSDKADHYGICGLCPLNKLTTKEKQVIHDSNRAFVSCQPYSK